jgi:hypothetical protein
MPHPTTQPASNESISRPTRIERERSALASNDAFCDMVVREAESMILHAPLDDLITFAYGSWDAARAAWATAQRSRFRQPRKGGASR